MPKIGIIGGSGLENPEILHDIEELSFSTPFGIAELKTGKMDGNEVVLLSRHGKQHTITPSHVNNRANIWALKEIGCKAVIATTACGSLREEIGRGDLVFPNQFIDFTRLRAITFFDTFKPGEMAHTPMAEPFDKDLRRRLILSAEKLQLKFHTEGTVITIEGPRFSTYAESNLFRLWGADIINMSIAPECILANELRLPYAAVAMSTDYDCWKTDEIPVTWEEVLKVFNLNVSKVIALIKGVVSDYKD